MALTRGSWPKFTVWQPVPQESQESGESTNQGQSPGIFCQNIWQGKNQTGRASHWQMFLPTSMHIVKRINHIHTFSLGISDRMDQHVLQILADSFRRKMSQLPETAIEMSPADGLAAESVISDVA